MSRPFSYNDENFTVIGNILFIHASIGKKKYVPGEPIFVIPQAIFARMTTSTQVAAVSNKTNKPLGFTTVACNSSGALFSMEGISEVGIGAMPRFLLTWFYLKDI